MYLVRSRQPWPSDSTGTCINCIPFLHFTVAPTPTPVTGPDGEEVFAEDYDDPDKDESSPLETEESTTIIPEPLLEEIGPLAWEVSACPNTHNPYHKCVAYCQERWGMKTFVAGEDMLKKRDRMLRLHPLPDGWEEVADPET